MTIHSKANSIAYDAGYDAIFGSKDQPVAIENSTQATASRERIYQELKRIAKEWIGQDDVAFASSFDDLGADSLDQIEMLMDIEETFEIEIDDDEASKFKTGNDVLEYLVIHVPN